MVGGRPRTRDLAPLAISTIRRSLQPNITSFRRQHGRSGLSQDEPPTRSGYRDDSNVRLGSKADIRSGPRPDPSIQFQTCDDARHDRRGGDSAQSSGSSGKLATPSKLQPSNSTRSMVPTANSDSNQMSCKPTGRTWVFKNCWVSKYPWRALGSFRKRVAFFDDVAFPAAVRGPVDRVQGFVRRIISACRARRSGLQADSLPIDLFSSFVRELQGFIAYSRISGACIAPHNT